jgi:hypothetical protein
MHCPVELIQSAPEQKCRMVSKCGDACSSVAPYTSGCGLQQDVKQCVQQVMSCHVIALMSATMVSQRLGLV